MKPIYGQFAAACALTLGLAACIPPSPEPTPAPSPAPVSTPSPTPASTPVAQAPVTENWIDAPQTAGDWSYGTVSGGTIARFSGSSGGPLFAIACMRGSAGVALIRYQAGSSSNPAMTIRTETATRTLPTRRGDSASSLAADLQARDPLLDAMALTRGRFAVETSNSPPLYLPAWSEVTRVIEDCR